MRLNPAFRPSISMNFTAAPVQGCAPKLLSMEAVSKPLPGIRQQTFELALSKRRNAAPLRETTDRDLPLNVHFGEITSIGNSARRGRQPLAEILVEKPIIRITSNRS